MPKLQNDITINNGANTPVAVTFAAKGHKSGSPSTAVFSADASATTQANQTRIEINVVRDPAKANQARTVSYYVELPEFTTDGDGIETQVGVSRAVVTFYNSPRASALSRAHLRAFVANLLNHTEAKECQLDLEPYW